MSDGSLPAGMDALLLRQIEKQGEGSYGALYASQLTTATPLWHMDVARMGTICPCGLIAQLYPVWPHCTCAAVTLSSVCRHRSPNQQCFLYSCLPACLPACLQQFLPCTESPFSTNDSWPQRGASGRP
jgi:hypothetical protein